MRSIPAIASAYVPLPLNAMRKASFTCAQVNDAFRIAFNGNGTYADAIAGIDRIRRHPQAGQLFTGTLCVVDPHSDARRVYEFFKSLVVPSVDFLFKDGNY